MPKTTTHTCPECNGKAKQERTRKREAFKERHFVCQECAHRWRTVEVPIRPDGFRRGLQEVKAKYGL